MRRTGWMLVAAVLVVGLMPGWVSAGEAETDSGAGEAAESPWAFGVGTRIGGYGFRHVKDETLSWNDCRMDGFGLFGTVDYGDYFFGELSVDYYHATGKTVASGMDRLSLHVSGAVGLRLLPDFVVRPYIQAGAGPEWTRMEVGGTSRQVVLAAPFMAVGGEVNLGKLKLGSHLRAAAMGLPDHLHPEAGGHDHGDGGSGQVRYETAGWMQFFARYEF